MIRRCKCCGCRFRVRPQNPNQQYCTRKFCQNERRRRWRRAKLRSDPAYRGNQRDSQKRWLATHPGYYRDYRARHPDYVVGNRALQKDRDRLKRDLATVTRTGAVLAKSDACPSESKVIPAYYELLPVQSENLAKRYASKRIFHLIPISCSDIVVSGPSCKETTRGTLPGASDTASLCPGPSP